MVHPEAHSTDGPGPLAGEPVEGLPGSLAPALAQAHAVLVLSELQRSRTLLAVTETQATSVAVAVFPAHGARQALLEMAWMIYPAEVGPAVAYAP